MQISKYDLLTIIILSSVFFSIAVWNLGLTQVPLTTWQSRDNVSFYIDLGKIESVSSVYLLVKNGSANVQVHSGKPGNWSSSIYNCSITYPWSYYVWSKIPVNSHTQYIRLDFTQAYVEIAEVAVLDQNFQQLSIVAILSENMPVATLARLFDEQDLVNCPPTYISQTYFDEVYYVRTAEQYLALQLPYEWTHPPLGKLIIATSISVFGFNPFGWRIMGVAFATSMIIVIYLLGKELFGTWIGGFASAFLLMFDFMVFTMGRMATVDIYVVFFSLVSHFFFLLYFKGVLKNGWGTSLVPLVCAVIFFALGFSTKWIVLYGFVGQLMLLLLLRLEALMGVESFSAKVKALLDRPFFHLYYFVLLAGAIYLLMFVPDMLAGRSFIGVFQLQGAMFSYHSTLNATHAFSSPWWSWPFILRPVWLSSSHLPNGFTSTIAAMGNPAVWWVGFAAVIMALDGALRRREFSCMYIMTVFFFQWLPYVLISRITFLYHFFVNVPILCLAITYFVNAHWNTRFGKAVSVAYFVVVVLLFMLFYPVISGVPATKSTISSLRWFNSWVF